jgi:hypothetical protein
VRQKVADQLNRVTAVVSYKRSEGSER